MSAISVLTRPPVAARAFGGCDSAPPVLTRNEWTVVRLALREADAGRPVAPSTTRLARLLRWITGTAAPVGLADPRLEAIRRFVWSIRRGRADADEHAAHLLADGFTRDQLCGIATLVR